MSSHLQEWLILLVRWLHIVAAIAWIGTSFFFIWLDNRLKRNADSTREGHIGDLWMVHSGGFYQVEKMLLGPNEVPQELHWFKWEAAFTWISGVFLLIMIFYTGAGTFLLDAGVSSIGFGAALAISILTILGSWLLYDLLWQSPLAKKAGFCHVLTVGMIIVVSYVLCQTLSGRAAYIHVGAMLGTWMVANVWVRILPGQQKMIDATKAGRPVDPAWGENAKNRSVHNNYFTLPVIFIMMSNHFPSTYGHRLNWLILLIIGCVGVLVRHYFNVRHLNKPAALWGTFLPALAGVIAVFIMTAQPASDLASDAESVKSSASAQPPEGVEDTPAYLLPGIDLELTGSIRGQVRYQGPVPKRRALSLPHACASLHEGPVYNEALVVRDGGLANAFIRIVEGLGDRSFPVPRGEVVLDQVGCIYLPHVVGVRAGQKLTFLNSDNEPHNVRSSAKINRGFNVGMPNQGMRLTKVLKHPELPVTLKCNIHPWMKAYVGVMEHPYFAVSDESGAFEMEHVPPGTYQVEIWHEVLGVQSTEVVVGEREAVDLEVEFRKP